MGYSEQSSWAGRWSILVGACLALIAAGSFVAFSLVASDAGASGLAGRIEALKLNADPVVITLGEPPNDREGRSDGRLASGSQIEGTQLDSVLGTRFFASPGPRSSAPARRDRDAKRPPDGWHKAPTAARTDSSTKHDKQRKSPPGRSSASQPAPEPNGVAKGHEKARGKGHDKHPGDG